MTGHVVVVEREGARGGGEGQTIDSLLRLWLLLLRSIPRLKTPQKLGRVKNLQAHSLKIVCTFPISAAFSTRQFSLTENQKKMKSRTEVGCVLCHSEPLSPQKIWCFSQTPAIFKKMHSIEYFFLFPPQAYWISIRYFFFFLTFEFCITF